MIKKKAIGLGIAIWIIITILFAKWDAPVDGTTFIGFPFHFYSQFEGESSLGSGVSYGFILNGLLLDLVALSAFIILIHIILPGKRKQIKIQL